MKLLRLTAPKTRDEVLSMIRDHETVNDKVRFDEKRGRPIPVVREKGNLVKIKCNMLNAEIRDSGFLEGTYFIGTLKENSGSTTLSGVILTAPIYHSMLAAIMMIFVLRCISLGAFNPVPVILLLFSLIMFKSEFDKQGTIERYLARAFKRLNG